MEAGSNQGRPFYHSIISSRMKLNSQQGYIWALLIYTLPEPEKMRLGEKCKTAIKGGI